MKKLILIVLCFICLIGCEKKEIKINYQEVNANLMETSLFKDTESVDISYLENKYELDTTGIIDYNIYMPLKTMTSSMYAIFKVKDDSVKEEIEKSFIKKYVDSWTLNVYDANEANLVNNMYKGKHGNYLIYIISSNNDKALEIIKK